LQQGRDLSELPLDVLRGFHASIGDDVYESALTLQASLDARKVIGGTAPERVREQIAAHRQRLGQTRRQ
jgi:argininosuccinate lyase